MEKGIVIANIILTPSNDGNVIRLVFPDLTQERRKEIVKEIKKMAEEEHTVNIDRTNPKVTLFSLKEN